MSEPLIQPPRGSQLKSALDHKGISPPAPKKNSGGHKATSVEIIREAVKRESPQADVERFMKVVAGMVKAHGVKLVQIGNTVFMLKPTGQPGQVEFHTFSTEQPQTLIERFKSGVNTLKQMGYTSAVSWSENPAFVRVAKETRLPVQISQVTMNGKPAYKFDLRL